MWVLFAVPEGAVRLVPIHRKISREWSCDQYPKSNHGAATMVIYDAVLKLFFGTASLVISRVLNF